MKELLFRGRFKVNKFRWNGTPIEYEFIESKTHDISAIYFNNNGDIWHVVIPYKDTCITLLPDYFTTFDIQQYTGVKDKHGVKIFEGDVVKHRFFPAGNNPNTQEYYYIGCIVFKYNVYGFDVHKKGLKIFNKVGEIIKSEERRRYNSVGDRFFSTDKEFEEYEVIGNIYDNPELIK